MGGAGRHWWFRALISSRRRRGLWAANLTDDRPLLPNWEWRSGSDQARPLLRRRGAGNVTRDFAGLRGIHVETKLHHRAAAMRAAEVAKLAWQAARGASLLVKHADSATALAHQRGTTSMIRKRRCRRLIHHESPVSIVKASQSVNRSDYDGIHASWCQANGQRLTRDASDSHSCEVPYERRRVQWLVRESQIVGYSASLLHLLSMWIVRGPRTP